tara:strand:+ start:34 stop:1251 length:1218 start_codon:yes stop_codon:yes gene_type:complete
MNFNNYKLLRKKETLVVFFLILFSIVVRIPVILIFGDTNLENEWGPLVNNLINHGTLSLKNLDGFLLPNLWMPPLYAYYIYCFSLFNLENQNFILLVLFSQILLASISVGVFYKINKNFFSEKISIFGSVLFSLLPLYLYACAQISSISLYIFLAIFFYYYFFKIIKKQNILSIFLFAFLGGLLILTRREFVAILVLSSFFLFIFFKVSVKKIFLIFIITIVTISPYLIRNALTFERIIIQAGFGYNVWKANNPNSKIEGSAIIDSNLQKRIDKIPKDKFYRINEDKIFLNEGIKYITENPRRYILLYFKKIAAFLFIDIDSSEPNYYNIFHYIPALLLGATSLFGIYFSNKKSHKLNYLILIFIFYVITFSFFAILPRYKLAIVPFQIIFTSIFINYVKKFFFR